MTGQTGQTGRPDPTGRPDRQTVRQDGQTGTAGVRRYGLEIDPKQIKVVNWSRRRKRTKGLMNPRPWGYASRGGNRAQGGNAEQAAEDIRKEFAEGKS